MYFIDLPTRMLYDDVTRAGWSLAVVTEIPTGKGFGFYLK